MRNALLIVVMIFIILPTSLLAQTDHLLPFKTSHEIKTIPEGSYPQHIVESRWEQNWLPYSITDIEYTSSGLHERLEYADPNGQELIEFKYDEYDQEIEKVLKIGEGQVWTNSGKETNEYNEDNLLQSNQSYTWNGSEWVMLEGTQYEYTMDGGRVSTLTVSYFRLETGWTIGERFVYSYEGDAQVPQSVITEILEDEAWVRYYKMEYEFSGDQVIALYLYTWTDEAWLASSKRPSSIVFVPPMKTALACSTMPCNTVLSNGSVI